jgi:hypothetical protein
MIVKYHYVLSPEQYCSGDSLTSLAMRLELHLNPRKIALTLGLIAVCLCIISVIGEYITTLHLDDDKDDTLIAVLDTFSVNAEQSVPTWYSVVNLLVASLVTAWIAWAKRVQRAPYARHWTGLALIFLYLSLDEGAVIHELFSEPLQLAFNTSGYLNFAWLLVGVPLVLLFALVYLRFLWHLPPQTRLLVILAGGLYVGGAVFVEALSANQLALDGDEYTFAYLVLGTIEELCEMLGVIVFIYAMLAYLRRAASVVSFVIGEPEGENVP